MTEPALNGPDRRGFRELTVPYDPETEPPPILSAAEFVHGYKPPAYVVDGIMQRSRLYTTTAITGSGKTAIALTISLHVAAGCPLGKTEVEQAPVLYFAAENPDDVRMRVILSAEVLGFDLERLPLYFVDTPFDVTRWAEYVTERAKGIGGIGLVVVDTGPAFLASLGVEEENSNTQMLAFARSLRDLTKLPGRPAVIVLTHPIKGAASKEQLVPRGGGALLAEVDGNYCIELDDDRRCATLHWTGKFRGPSFEPIPFVLETATCDRLRDARGRKLWSVVAKVGDDNVAENVERARREDEDDLLVALSHKPGLSLAGYATLLGWRTGQGEPEKMRVHRRLKALEQEGLAKVVRGKWELTRRGREEAETIEREART